MTRRRLRLDVVDVPVIINRRDLAEPARSSVKERLWRLGGSPAALGCVALVCIYLAVMGGHNYSIDGLLMFRQAVSLVHDHSLRFGVPIYWGNTYTTSEYGIGLSLLYVPGVALMSAVGLTSPVPHPNAYDWDLLYRDPVYALGGAPIHILVTVATAYLVFRFVRYLGYSDGAAILGLIGYGLASPAAVYARGDFSQPLLGFSFVGGLFAAARIRTSPGLGPLMACAALICLAVLTRPVEGSLLLPAAIGMVAPSLRLSSWTRNTYRPVAMFVSAFVIAVGITLLVNWGRFGSPFQTGYHQVSWGTPIWIGLPGVLVSPSRGILWQFPLVILAPLGWRRLWVSEHRRMAIVVAGLTLVLLLNTALWVPWWGAQSWGARLFVPALPLLAVLAAIGASSSGSRLPRWLPPVLIAGGVVWALPGSFTDLLGGYAARYDGSAVSYALSGFPPAGAWRFVHRVLPLNLSDQNGIDIVWFRIAPFTGDLSVAIPIILLGLGVFLAIRAMRLTRRPGDPATIAPPRSQAEPAPG